MNILQVYNYYQQPGGEEQVFTSLVGLLESKGHKVIKYSLHNDLIDQMSRLTLAQKTIWNSSSYQSIEQLILVEKPDVAHFHNIFPLISPSAYYACQKHGVPVVQTLHNYRLICPNALLFRDLHVCEDCLGKIIPYPGIIHACYRNSSLQTSMVVLMLSIHRLFRTWYQQVDRYISLSKFTAQKFIEAGFPRSIFEISPNSIYSDPGKKTAIGDYALYVGRLSQEKGLRTLLKAWEKIPHIPLKIVGDGPLAKELQEFVLTKELGNVELLGRLSNQSVYEMMKQARFLIFPSECYESCGLSIIEAYACGLPVVASRLGAIVELILDGRTGLLFDPGNHHDLADKVLSIWNKQEVLSDMSASARNQYEQEYTSEQNYASLMQTYHKVISEYTPKQ